MNNDLGNRTSATETARQVTYTYDPANQVLSDFLTGPWFFSPTAAVATYSYDPAGNRATTSGFAPGASNVLTTYTNGPGNELTSAVSSASSPTTQTFDLNGNLLTRQIGSAYTTYTWDGENRLLSIAVSPSTAFPTGAIVTNIYDGNGLRQGYRDSTGLTTLTYDGQNIYRRDVQFIGSVQRYTNEPGGYGPLIGQSDTRSGVTSQIYAVSDLSGNIRNWWSSSTRGNLDPYAYEAYGVEWITPAPEPPITYNVPFFYEGDVGYYQDATTGLYYIKARWYDPVTGRFISEDPIGFDGGDWNQYVYVKNEPVNWTDSEGLRSHKKKHASKIVRLMVIPFISGHTESPAPYEHAYIDFSPGKCATEEAYGFWSKPGKGTRYPFPPHACFDCPGLVRVWPGTPLDPDIAKVKAGTWPVTQDSSNTNPAFIRRLCKNILASKKKPPNYSTDPLTFETCGSWAHQMWDSYK
jgi:RHS repeat-associated protein